MEDFSCLRVELLKYGFSEVRFLESFCLTCGSWRCGIEFPQPEIACPVCGVLRHASWLGCSGFSRTPGQWERVRAPFSPHALSFIHSSIDDAERFRNERKRRYHERPHFNRGSKILEASAIPWGLGRNCLVLLKKCVEGVSVVVVIASSIVGVAFIKVSIASTRFGSIAPRL